MEGITLEAAQATIAQQAKRLASQSKEIEALKASLERLKERIAKLTRELFGKRSEKDKLGPKKSQGKDRKPAANQSSKKRGKSREEIDRSNLPHKAIQHDISEEEKNCSTCGKRLRKFGQDITKRLEALAQQCYMEVHIVNKYCCQGCDTVVKAKKPTPSPIPKGRLGAGLLAVIIAGKYYQHQPIYRQAQQFKEEGTPLSDGHLGNNVMQCGELLAPMKKAFEKAITQSEYLQVDETPVKLLSPEKQAYLWCYLNPLKKLVLFDFHKTRKSAPFEARLSEFTGVWQTDGYNGYSHRRKETGNKSFGCMAHVRRKFVDVTKLCPDKKVGVAYEAVGLIRQLYAIEKTARQKGLSPKARQALRQKETPLIFKALKQLCEQANAPPDSALGRAVNYSLNQWPYITRYVNDGRVEIDNNWVENAIRPVALGRKNWLFIQHEGSGQINALFLSLVHSARMNHLKPREYLHALLLQVHELRRSPELAEQWLPYRVTPEQIKAVLEKQPKGVLMSQTAVKALKPKTH